MEQDKSKITRGAEARKVALQLYTIIIEKRTSLSGLTDNIGGAHNYLKLNPSDRSLVKAILQTALRHRQQIEHILKDYLKKPLPLGASRLNYLLHISLAQLLYLRVASFATINIAVDLAKQDPRMQRFHKLVNAILRSVVRDITANKLENKFFKQQLQNLPKWFSDLLVKDYGADKAEAIAKAINKPSALDLTVKTQPKNWAQKLEATILWGNSIRLNNSCKTNIQKLEGYEEGEWWVQDCASTIAALFLNKKEFNNIADLCAAPGGKAAQLINQGAKVTAFEINPSRYERLRENMARLQMHAELINTDFQTYKHHNFFDAALLDAPCSSTGTINKNSDILWTKGPEDIKSLSNLQYQMLQAAAKYVKIGGTIIFSNCSLAKLEGENMIEKLLKQNNNLTLKKFTIDEDIFSNYPQLQSFITKEGFLRTSPSDFAKIFPHLPGAMDGFFIARLVKSA